VGKGRRPCPRGRADRAPAAGTAWADEDVCPPYGSRSLDLSRLAAACGERERWEFLFSISPLRVRGGTGSPVNPIALF
jgi:hypothetical protein